MSTGVHGWKIMCDTCVPILWAYTITLTQQNSHSISYLLVTTQWLDSDGVVTAVTAGSTVHSWSTV